MRRGIKSRHENEVNERNRVKEYMARTDPFRWNGSEKWPPMCESSERFVKALADNIGDACVQNENARTTQHTPSRGTSHGTERNEND